MNLTPQQLTDFRHTAIELQLFGWRLLSITSDEDVMRICNGIGPEWFPKPLRTLIDKFNPTLILPSALHDLGYYYGNGTFRDFATKNFGFRKNGIILAHAKFSVISLRRYCVIHQAVKFSNLCNLLGWPAYVAAMRDRKSLEAKHV